MPGHVERPGDMLIRENCIHDVATCPGYPDGAKINRRNPELLQKTWLQLPVRSFANSGVQRFSAEKIRISGKEDILRGYNLNPTY